MLENLLRDYIFDTENPVLNYQIGIEYENLDQTAAAVSYFLRSAERTDDKSLSYECLLRIGRCFEKQQNRNFTIKSVYRTAISLCPDRPEAYYQLIKNLDKDKNYSEVYLLCKIAEFNCKDKSYRNHDLDYPGIWGLYYYEAIASWWFGKNDNSKNLFKILKNIYWNELRDIEKDEVIHYKSIIESKMGSDKKKIVDYCTFFEPTGKEMLKLRIAILKDYVDEFIVVESNKTQSGMPISYELENVIEEWNLPKEKIRILKLEIPEAEDLEIQEIDVLNCYENNSSNKESVRARVRDRLQKNAILSVLDDYDDDTVFIISDIDEIIDPKRIEFVSNTVRQHPECVIRIPIVHLEGRADLRVYMKDSNQPKEWTGMIMTTKSHLKIVTPNQIRSGICNFPIQYLTDGNKKIEDMGWHFSWMGGKQITKLKSKVFTHHADSFSYLVSNSYSDNDMNEFLENIELKEGSISPSGDKNTILKSYPIKNLPKEVFEIPEVEKFLFTTTQICEKNIMTSTKQDTKEEVIRSYEKYDNQMVWGWCTLNKAGCLVDYVDEICTNVDNPVCVEIGVFAGKSVFPVALELKRHKKGRLYAIDPWTNDEAVKGYESTIENYEYWKNIDLNSVYNFFMNLIKEHELEDYIEVVRLPSDDVPIIENIDYLYIDGQHTDQSHRDVMKFASRIKVGGYCVVDDVPWGEVAKVPSLLEQLGFMHVHTVDAAYIFRRTNIVDFTKDETNIFKINTSYAKRAFVVDNFYEDPMAIRKFAQQQEFVDGGLGRGFIGRRTVQQFLFPGIKETFESILGKKITQWKEHGMNGRFQLNIAGEPLVYHCDAQKYAAMIYLTPNAPPACGTSTFMHKATRAHHNSDPRINEVFYGVKTTMDRNPYDKVDSFGNIFNRLVIFDGGCIHGASDYFGADIEDGRLWHMFFFDAE